MTTIHEQVTSTWLTHARDVLGEASVGSLAVQNDARKEITLEWETVSSYSPRLNEKIKELVEVFTDSFVMDELQFARTCSEAIPSDWFLNFLSPLFEKGDAPIDWLIIEKKIRDKIFHFLSETNFSGFSKMNDLNIFVVALDKDTQEKLGAIQFLITSEYEKGTVRVCFRGVSMNGRNCGLEKLLMSSIFALLPDTKRLFLHLRRTSEQTIGMYKEWGFTPFSGPHTDWFDMEYLAEQATVLQDIAQKNR